MARLCEAALERQLKRLFIGRSAFVQDNGCVKNTRPFAFIEVLAAHSHPATRPTIWRAMLASGQAMGLSGKPWPSRLAVCALLSVCAMAGHDHALASNKGDHERALQAVQSGQVLPLAKVLALVEKAQPGQVLEVELENEKQQWQYEIKLLQPDGRLMKLQVDARTGEILKRKTR